MTEISDEHLNIKDKTTDEMLEAHAEHIKAQTMALVAIIVASAKQPLSDESRKKIAELRVQIDAKLSEISGVRTLPSAHQIGDEVSVWLTVEGGPLVEFATVEAVHFSVDKVHYDVVTYTPAPAKLKSVDSAYVHPVGWTPDKP